ncbi:MAG: hypothetical protein JO267_03780 [Alphaproteobacteria bacterium]|nr:hypothetical protein [Alphaproteobacteria bacterium]
MVLRVSEDRGDLVLELLRALRGDIADAKTDLVEIRERIGLLESLYASLSGRLDRVAGDLALIKRRLDLVEV